MKIAIIGTGIAGNVAAYYLNKKHDIKVFEANDYVGGHSHTHDILMNGSEYAVDTGFIVFNNKTYPHFTKLLKELEVEVQPSNMSFSVKCEKSGLEYNGTTLNSLFSQRSNLFKPSFYRMIKDILRFNKESVEELKLGNADVSLGEFLSERNYGSKFIEQYLIPMGAAVWSANPEQMMAFPAGFFIRFFHNHGMLSVNDRPQWYVIKGGSKEYVKKLTSSFSDKINTEFSVKSVKRSVNGVELILQNGYVQYFDEVFIATHSDQALAMLDDSSEIEKSVLSKIPYQQNEAILHTDKSILPKKKLAWAAWNYHILGNKQDKVALTYNMNILQSLDSNEEFCVTLNNEDAINPNKIIKKIKYAHPIFTPDGIAAQKKQREINGQQHTYFCGAYWRFGFHEDGVWSALQALKHFEEKSNAQLHIRRAS
ncbi:MAG: FAD-dependent oxidoreductase [Gammaproteobacteria bacterium]|nr:FAD-dependent oxidoreductase [Gammaproteobacteria bacterium]